MLFWKSACDERHVDRDRRADDRRAERDVRLGLDVTIGSFQLALRFGLPEPVQASCDVLHAGNIAVRSEAD